MAALLVGLCLSCKETKKETEKEAMEAEPKIEEVNVDEVSFTMEAKSGSEVSGKVTFKEESGSVSMVAELAGLSPGEHAIHLHEKADCSSARTRPRQV